RSNRMKVLVHDGIGIWLCARRLHQGSFTWAELRSGTRLELTVEQLRALTIGLPWHRIGEGATIRMVCEFSSCGTIACMQLHDQIAAMDEQQLRKLAAELIEKVTQQDQEIRTKAEAIERDQRELHRRQLKIEQLTHEMAVLKRWKFAARSERLDSG